MNDNAENIDRAEDDDTQGHGHPGEHPAFPLSGNRGPTAPKTNHDDDYDDIGDDTTGHFSGAVRPDPN